MLGGLLRLWLHRAQDMFDVSGMAGETQEWQSTLQAVASTRSSRALSIRAQTGSTGTVGRVDRSAPLQRSEAPCLFALGIPFAQVNAHATTRQLDCC